MACPLLIDYSRAHACIAPALIINSSLLTISLSLSPPPGKGDRAVTSFSRAQTKRSALTVPFDLRFISNAAARYDDMNANAENGIRRESNNRGAIAVRRALSRSKSSGSSV